MNSRASGSRTQFSHVRTLTDIPEEDFIVRDLGEPYAPPNASTYRHVSSESGEFIIEIIHQCTNLTSDYNSYLVHRLRLHWQICPSGLGGLYMHQGSSY